MNIGWSVDEALQDQFNSGMKEMFIKLLTWLNSALTLKLDQVLDLHKNNHFLDILDRLTRLDIYHIKEVLDFPYYWYEYSFQW